MCVAPKGSLEQDESADISFSLLLLADLGLARSGLTNCIQTRAILLIQSLGNKLIK